MQIDFSLITLISLAVALLIQPARKYADRQAQLSYLHSVGAEHAAEPPENVWLEDRHLVGRWGCLYIILQAVQGIAIILTIGGVVYWWLF
ncbi:MAG: hypothetical protein PVI81_06945 [Anaerolineales bacterium]|jgi:hypothetical protein